MRFLDTGSTSFSRLWAGIGLLAATTISTVLLGPAGAVASVIFMPVVLGLAVKQPHTPRVMHPRKTQDNKEELTGWLSRFLGEISHPTVAMVVEIDDFHHLQEMHEPHVIEDALSFTQSVIEAHLTDADVTVALGGPTFGSALAPQAPHDLEAMLQLCTRIQHGLAKASVLGNAPIRLSASIGFASSSKLRTPSAAAVFQCATTALAEARTRGPGAVRAYSVAMSAKRDTMRKLCKETKSALDRGEVFAYYQPQINIQDGTLSGFEALTRWRHPERGILAPADYLPMMEHSGLMESLGDTMVREALKGLTFWEDAGLSVPRIGVNFSTIELRDPHLVDRIALLLDSADVAPQKLVIEVLETVMATDADEEIVSNLAALADLGCSIDLDDFGTGYASISNIRRFSVERIKIDRSFVGGLEKDEQQQDMVAAILTMADRLGVKTLAEGIETRGEYEALKSLGVHNAQGFHIARPMPIEETRNWIEAFQTTEPQAIALQKRAS